MVWCALLIAGCVCAGYDSLLLRSLQDVYLFTVGVTTEVRLHCFIYKLIQLPPISRCGVKYLALSARSDIVIRLPTVDVVYHGLCNYNNNIQSKR